MFYLACRFFAATIFKVHLILKRSNQKSLKKNSKVTLRLKSSQELGLSNYVIVGGNVSLFSTAVNFKYSFWKKMNMEEPVNLSSGASKIKFYRE